MITPGPGACNVTAIPARTRRRSVHAFGGRARKDAGVHDRSPLPPQTTLRPTMATWSGLPGCQCLQTFPTGRNA
eukprot:11180963-Lingulodinium_polyedra.AAC.1